MAQAARATGSGKHTIAASLPIVFLHSLAGRPAQWDAQLAHFRGRRPAFALALPGHPGGVATSSFSFDSMAESLMPAIDALRLQRFVLVGHSGGAAVAAAMAAANPKRVGALVLVDAGTDLQQFPTAEVQAFLDAFEQRYLESAEAHWTAILSGARPEVREQVMADLRTTRRETMLGALNALPGFAFVEALKSFGGPIFAINTPLSDGPLGFHNLVPRIRAERIEGTSHWVQMDKPDEFNAILDRFLSMSD